MRGPMRGAALAGLAAWAIGVGPVGSPLRAAWAQSCQVEIVIDHPAPDGEATVRQPISGWAVDRAASYGTGIEAMRLALDPPDDAPPDVAYLPLAYGVPRPDVAYALGSGRYLDAGFMQDWRTLDPPPGRHRLVVQAKSACGWTSVERMVRVPAPPAGSDAVQEVIVPLATTESAADRPPLAPPAPTLGSPLDRTPPIPRALARPPFGLHVEALGPTTVRLTWDAAPGAASYNVYLANEDDALAGPRPGIGALRLFGLNGLQRVQTAVADTTTTLTGLDGGVSYRFVVRAASEAGGEIASSEIERLTLPSVAPNTLTASTGNSPGSVALSWTAVPDAATYALLSGAGLGPVVPDPQRTHLTTTSTTLERLPPGTYTFQVEARDAAGGRLTRSNLAQVNVDPGGTAALVPPAPGAAALGGAPAPSLAPPSTVPPVPGPPPAALVPPAPGAGPGGVPGPANLGLPLPGVNPALGPAPAAAGSAFPLQVGRPAADSVRLDWPSVPGAASYAVYQAQGSTPMAFAFTTAQPTTTLVGLARGVEYRFQVRARNGADQEFATSTTATVTIE